MSVDIVVARNIHYGSYAISCCNPSTGYVDHKPFLGPL